MSFQQDDNKWFHNNKITETFPVQNHIQAAPGEVPLVIAEEVYKEYAAQFSVRQSLAQLKERGGFGYAEMLTFLYEHIKRIESNLKK